MKMKCLVVFFAALLVGLPEASGKKKPMGFLPVEVSVMKLLQEIRETEDDSLAVQKHFMIADILAGTFTYPDAYKYPFDSLKTIGMVYAPCKKFRLISWNHSFRDGTHRYFALLVFPVRKHLSMVIRMTDLSDIIPNPEHQELDANGWFGALYYKVLPKKTTKDGRKYYTLLGADLNDLNTKKKIIDVLVVGEDGSIHFGAPIFELNGWFRHRLIFEFAADQNMYLGYNRWKRRIEFDHLSPLAPYLVGAYEYYEPDLRLDGLKYRGRHWKHYKYVSTALKDRKTTKRSLPKPPGRRDAPPPPIPATPPATDETGEQSGE